MFSRARSIARRARSGIFFLALLAILALSYRPPFAQLVPPLATPPLALPEISRPSAEARTVFVPSGGDLQTTLDNARPGDIIALQPGAAFVGNFTLPRNSGAEWIVIRSAAQQSLPPAGSRIAPSNAQPLPKIVTPNSAPALTAAAGAHHFHLVGLEIEAAPTAHPLEALVRVGDGADEKPTDIIIDRCYIHGNAAGGVARGLALEGERITVVDSYLSDFRGGAASRAVTADGRGPFKIVNNYIAAAGENVVFGAAADAVPADIEIRGNFFHKPLIWKRDADTVKNFLALNSAERALIENNVFENNWSEDAAGFAVVLSAGEAGAGSTLQDITFRKNVVRRSGAGIAVMGQTPALPGRQTRRVLIQDNLFEEIGGAAWGGSGVLFQVVGVTADVVIDHNTGLQNGKALITDGATHSGFVYQNNISLDNQTAAALGYGDAWSARFPGYVFARNVLTGGSPSGYPTENFFPASADTVGFVDPANGDYRLSATSPYYNAGTDGVNIGADYDALKTAAFAAVRGERSS
ncbi:MAG TPA: hypothetical protein VGH50_17430 [Candidatus Binatia bacterium]